MIHAHHFLLFVRREISEYFFFSLQFLITAFLIFKFFTFSESWFFNSLLLSTLMICFFTKSVMRKIYYLYFQRFSDFRQSELITGLLLFSLTLSFLILLLFLLLSILLTLNGVEQQHISLLNYFGMLNGFLIPVFIFELSNAQIEKSGIATIFRWTTGIFFISATLFPLIFHPNPALIVQFYVLAAFLRLLIFLILLIDRQLLDFYSISFVKLKTYFLVYYTVLTEDFLYWFSMGGLFWLMIIQLPESMSILWVFGFFLFVIPLLTATQLLNTWGLIFKNFIRLDLEAHYIGYVQHINTLHIVFFFGWVPLGLLILKPMMEFEFSEIHSFSEWLVIYSGMTISALTGYFISNPQFELAILFQKKKELLSIVLSSVFMLIVSGWFFIEFMGWWGIFYACALGGFIFWLGINLIIQPMMSCEFKYIFPYKKLTRVLFSAIFSLAAGYSITLMDLSDGHKWVWVIVTYLIFYTVLILYFHILKVTSGSGFVNWTRRIGNFH